MALPLHERGRQEGTALVEFALVAGLLLTLLLTGTDIGRAWHVRLVLTAAAREGARRAALDAGWSPRVDAKVLAILQAGGLSGAADVEVSPAGPLHFGQDVMVTVRYALPLYSPVSRALLGPVAWAEAALITRVEGTHG